MEDDQNSKLPVEVANKFLDNQRQELEIKLQETNIRSEDLQNQKEVALATLKAQAIDRREIRDTYKIESSKSKRFTLGIFIIIALFILALVYLGESALAKDIIDIVTKAGLGVIGGYGFARWQMRDYIHKDDLRDE